MNFYSITSKGNPNTNNLLREACEKRNIKYSEIDISNINFYKLPELNKGDLLYRVSLNTKAFILEKILVKKGVATLYKSTEDVIFKNVAVFSATMQTISLEKSNLPIPKTIYIVPKEKQLLKKYINQKIGKPPYVIKISPSMQGQGIFRVDSYASLNSIIDFLFSINQQFLIRKYIPVTSSARLVVLGNKVISSIQFTAPSDDFRSNVQFHSSIAKNFSPAIKRTAIKATHVLGYEFGGVDILISHGRHYLTEVNFPCCFHRTQEISGVDIAGKIIDYLVAKSKK
ncbi:hypothetical protein KKF61_04805 [Patescibacteria group bacterium]|nr:hypothetical protein [Patescibacteria group bacterium]